MTITARTFAALFGGIYLALGACGFIPALWERPQPGPPLDIRVFHASLFGLFAVNIILSMMHGVIGLWGTMAANNRYSSLIFARAGCIVFALLGIAGLIPLDDIRTLWGTTPLYGHNVWLHLGTAVVALYFSFKPGYSLTAVGVKDEMNPHRSNT